MESRVKLLGHPVHQMLVVLPAGLFIMAAVLDIVGAFVESAWIPTVTYWNIALGIATAALAAIFGVADWVNIPQGTRARRIGSLHGAGNALVVVLFAASFMIRMRDMFHRTNAVSLALEVLALVLLTVTAWLGGELVDRLGVGVDEGAHVDAPSSLRTKHIV